MAIHSSTAFISYSRVDSDFALKLAEDLQAAGASVWLDQIELEPGKPWDIEIQRALIACNRMLVVLSPTSVNSTNVLDEVSFALKKQKTVIPVLYQDCEIPLRLHRLQYVNLTNYSRGLKALLKSLADPGQPPAAAAPVPNTAVPNTAVPVPAVQATNIASPHTPDLSAVAPDPRPQPAATQVTDDSGLRRQILRELDGILKPPAPPANGAPAHPPPDRKPDAIILDELSRLISRPGTGK